MMCSPEPTAWRARLRSPPWHSDSPRAAATGAPHPVDPADAGAEAALDQLRVLPAQGRRLRGRAVGRHPPARAGAARLRVGHLRRRRHHPGPHRAGHRADRPRDHADAAGPPHLRGRLRARSCARSSASMPRRGSATSSPCAATRRATSAGSGSPHPEGLDHADELVALVRALGDFTVGRRGLPRRAPGVPELRPRRRGAGAQGAMPVRASRSPRWSSTPTPTCGCATRVAARRDLPITPGLMPVTNLAPDRTDVRS